MKEPSHPPINPPPSIPEAESKKRSRRESVLDSDGRPRWSKLEIFRGMPDDVVDQLRDVLTPILFEPGQVILEQGQTGDDMYLLDRGSVKVSVVGEVDSTNFERVLAAPAMFGEMALITKAKRSATITAETAVRSLRIDRQSFSELVDRNPQSAVFVTRLVGERLLEAGSIRRVGKYEVAGQLGEGAVATVFEAIHPTLGKSVALKMLSHALVYHHGFAEQFQGEAKLVAHLNHEHIVRVLDTEEAYGTHFIVMEKLTGTLLEDLIETGPHLAWGAIRRILKEICLALQYSHEQGLLHRDIKPSNVFLTEDRRVKILDFGIAVHEEASEAAAGHLLGTPYYMSPEQILGSRLDGRADLYSTGILAYELCTRVVPFDADTLDDLLRMHLNKAMPDPRALQKDIPDDLCAFIARSTAKKASERYGSCGEAAAFLQAAAELPLVNRFELATLAITYHPSRRELVDEAVEQLKSQLDSLAGVSLLHGKQEKGKTGP